MAEPVLRVETLVVRFSGRRGGITVIDDVSFDINAHETLSLVGESGSGKTTIGRAPTPAGDTRGSSPAGSGSGSRSPGHWRSTRR